MKIFIQKSISILGLFLLITLFSCASKPLNQNQTISFTENQEEIEVEEVIELPPSPEEIFIQELSDISIEILSKPEEIVKGETFKNPYQIQVLKDNAPLANFELTIEYPLSRNEFTKIDVLTDENGSYIFTPESPNFAANTNITVSPKALNDDETVLNAVKEKSVQAEWKVKSDILKSGAILFVWDFDTKNRPTINSNELISEFRSRGSNLFGNAPMNEASEIGKDFNKIYKAKYEIVKICMAT